MSLAHRCDRVNKGVNIWVTANILNMNVAVTDAIIF